MRTVIFSALLMLLPIQATLAQASSGPQQRYSWVDAKGHKHVSDEIPADAVKFGYDVINRYGRVIRHVDGAKTPAELAAEKRRQEVLRQQREQERRDRTLLNTYPTAASLAKSQQAQEDMIEQRIDATRINMKSQLRSLADLLDHAAQRKQSGQTVPQYLQDNIAKQRDVIRKQRDWISKTEKKLADTRTEHAATLAHYRELKGLPAKPAEAKTVATDDGTASAEGG